MTAPRIKPARYAVAAFRRDPPDALDFFPTPPWATRALIKRFASPEPTTP